MATAMADFRIRVKDKAVIVGQGKARR
jgi:hypothetical protein